MIFQCKKCDEPIQGMVKTGPDNDGTYHVECHGEEVIRKYVDQAIEKYPDTVSAYKSGQTELLDVLVSEVSSLSEGTADLKMAEELLKKKLNNENV